MIYYFGRETFALGLKNYFAKHNFKNTVLSDFVSELALAAK
jgi:aminopeptidase N